jgi:hypothetical protein
MSLDLAQLFLTPIISEQKAAEGQLITIVPLHTFLIRILSGCGSSSPVHAGL